MSSPVDESDSQDKVQNNSPVVVEKRNSKFGVGGIGSWLAIGVVLTVVLAVLIVRSQDKEEDVLAFAPADSYLAIEIENLEGAAGVISQMPLWKNKALEKKKIIDEFVEWFDQDAELFRRFIGVVKSIAYIESFVERKPVEMVVLRAGNTWDIESYFRREYSTITTPVRVAKDMTGLEITRKDKSIFYLKKIANFVLITDNKELLKRALAAFKKDELSLAECNIRFGDGDGGVPRLRIYTAINSYFINYPEDRSFFPPKVYSMIAGDSAFLYEATLNEAGFVAEGRIIKSIAAAYATGDKYSGEGNSAFWSVIGWIILVIVIIFIGLPLLFVLSTLLLALYFFLVAWWKGELVEIDPPLAEMSREMKEDISSGKSSIGKKKNVESKEAVSEATENKQNGSLDKQEDIALSETIVVEREKSEVKVVEDSAGQELTDSSEKLGDDADIATAETIIVNRENKPAEDVNREKLKNIDVASADTVVIERDTDSSSSSETDKDINPE